jgi:uncharacterized cupin superfamily protein
MTTHVAGRAHQQDGWTPLASLLASLDADAEMTPLDGDPDVRTLSVSEERGGVSTGYATAQPAKVRTWLSRTEVLFVIEGSVTAELEGDVTVDLQPGDFIQLDANQTITWTYHEPVRLFYVLHDPPEVNHLG